MTDLDTLPIELIVSIFEHLDVPSLLAASAVSGNPWLGSSLKNDGDTQTCREWRKLSQIPSLVYSTLCYRYGVKDGPPGQGWPVPKRIEALKRWHARWNSLRWLKGYTFCTDAGDLWEMFSSVYAQSSIGTSKIGFRKAVSASAQQREKQWSIDTDVQVRDFGIDLFQDLLVIVGKAGQSTERSLHLRTMSTGEPHLAAKSPNLHQKMQYEQIGSTCAIQVSNENVGVLFYNQTIRETNIYPVHELVIWNWKTGVVLLHLVSNEENFISSYCFLSDTRVLAGWAVIPSPAVEDPHKKSSLDVYDVSQPTTIPEKRFLLPPMQPDATAGSFTIYCDPTPTPNEVVPRPFYSSPDHKICVVTVSFLYQRSGITLHENINFIFFISTLLADYPYVEISSPTLKDFFRLGELDSVPSPFPSPPPSPTSNPSQTPPVSQWIPWSQWGEKTRLTLWRMPISCYTICVSGTRIVRRVLSPIQRRYKIQVCDFNPYATPDPPPEELADRWAINFGGGAGAIERGYGYGGVAGGASALTVDGLVAGGVAGEQEVHVGNLGIPLAGFAKSNPSGGALSNSTQRYVHDRQNNVFENALLFQNTLYGFLPYLEITTRSTFEMEDVMIDHDNIYLVHGRSGPSREIEVLSF